MDWKAFAIALLCTLGFALMMLALLFTPILVFILGATAMSVGIILAGVFIYDCFRSAR